MNASVNMLHKLPEDNMPFYPAVSENPLRIFTLLRDSHLIKYFKIKAKGWSDFKEQLIEIFSTPLSYYGKVAILHIRLPEETQSHAIPPQAKTELAFSIEKELKARFNNAFCSTIHFSAKNEEYPFQMDVIVGDSSRVNNDSELHAVILDAICLSQICHLCEATEQAFHYHLEVSAAEINKEIISELFHTHILKRHPLHSKSRILIQIGLMWEDRYIEQCVTLTRILNEIFMDEHEYFDIGYAGKDTSHFEIDVFLTD